MSQPASQPPNHGKSTSSTTWPDKLLLLVFLVTPAFGLLGIYLNIDKWVTSSSLILSVAGGVGTFLQVKPDFLRNALKLNITQAHLLVGLRVISVVLLAINVVILGFVYQSLSEQHTSPLPRGQATSVPPITTTSLTTMTPTPSLTPDNRTTPVTVNLTPPLNTASETATAAATDPYPLNRTLSFFDPLYQPARWANVSKGQDSPCQFVGNTYHVKEMSPHNFYYCPSIGLSPFSNFTFEVQLRVAGDDCGGIIFLKGLAMDVFDFFKVCQDGTYDFERYDAGTHILTSSSSTAIHQGLNQQNTIAIVVTRNTFYLYVNQSQIDSVSDPNYSSGNEILLISNSVEKPTVVTYSDARMWI